MSDIVYRKWAYEDILAIAELEKKCFSDPWSFSMLADTFFNDNVITAAAEENGKIVGYGFVVSAGEMLILRTSRWTRASAAAASPRAFWITWRAPRRPQG